MFKTFLKTLYDVSVYEAICEKKKFQLGYIVFLVVLFNLVYLPFSSVRNYDWLNGFNKWMRENIPPVVIKDGRVISPDLNNVLVYSDRDSLIIFGRQPDEIKKFYPNKMVVKKDSIVIKLNRSERNIRRDSYSSFFCQWVSFMLMTADYHQAGSNIYEKLYSLKNVKSFSLDENDMNFYLRAAFWLMIIINTIFGILQAAFIIVLISVLTAYVMLNSVRVVEADLKYVQVFNVSLYALTPAVLIMCSVYALGLDRGRNFFFAFLIAGFVYVYFLNAGLKACTKKRENEK
ncbi:MAG: DUF1189 family protein [Candidatus Auribacterota bacterium]|nr:DUF1189 family protein [Candidatus Auribacterota bacterium]